MVPFPAYLTIDDAPSAVTGQKLDILEARGIVTAVWFCRGEFIEARPYVAELILQRGHAIGNHSWNHPTFSKMRLTKCKAQIERTEALIDEIHARAGIPRPAKWFRFPWGDKGAGTDLDLPGSPEGVEKAKALQEFLREHGFVAPPFKDVVYPAYKGWDVSGDVDTWWTLDTYEWALISRKPRDDLRTIDDVLRRIDNWVAEKSGDADRVASAEIIVIHDFEATAETFEPIIDRLVARGATFLPFF
jgi:peptidoglycan/xylan/chitin deacetylase (PgdA/CDA1 family)